MVVYSSKPSRMRQAVGSGGGGSVARETVERDYKTARDSRWLSFISFHFSINIFHLANFPECVTHHHAHTFQRDILVRLAVLGIGRHPRSYKITNRSYNNLANLSSSALHCA